MSDMIPGWLCDERQLRERLLAKSMASSSQDLSLGVLVEGRAAFISTHSGIEQRLNSKAEVQTVRAGCLAKCVTATLIASAVSEGLLNWSDYVGSLLPLTAKDREKIGGVTIRQLLNHTHGLDASRMLQVPRTHSGRLDAASFCNRLGERRISQPGEMYSYGNAGGWLAGILLEKLYEKHYSDLLSAKWPMHGLDPDNTRSAVCPSTGDQLAFTNGQWLRFLQVHCESVRVEDGTERPSLLAELQLDQTPLPGWHPTEQAACLGWKFFGDGWLGHNSNLFDRTALLRFNPARRIAIVVSAPGKSAFFALGALLGECLTEFSRLRPPRYLSQAELAALDLSKYAGVYAQAQTSIEINNEPGCGLSFVSRDRPSAQVRSSGSLHAGRDEIFLVRSDTDREFEFLQYLPAARSQAEVYLWDGKQLWPRVK